MTFRQTPVARTLVFLFSFMFLIFACPLGADGAYPQTISLTIGESKAYLDGQEFPLPVPPRVEKGTTLVPLRFVAQSLGTEVGWDPATKQVRLFLDSRTIILTLGSLEAQVDGEPRQLLLAPTAVQGTTLVPLRFVGEELGAMVRYDAATKGITVERPNRLPVASFTISPVPVIVGQEVIYTDTSFDPDGDELVDRVWENNQTSFSTPGTYSVRLKVQDAKGAWSDWYSLDIEVQPPPNQPPQALFRVKKTPVAQGETVEYEDLSNDPDGDQIIERRWTGRQRAFFSPGPREVTLEVKDAKGAWSEPYTLTIEVSKKILYSEMAYNFVNPLPGEIMNCGADINGYSVEEDIDYSDGGPMLVVSNNPEKVTGEGILYADTIGGPARIFYHHRNGSSGNRRFCLVLTNRNPVPTLVEIQRQGTAGPSGDEFAAGKQGMLRFLSSNSTTTLNVMPGTKVVLNSPGVVIPSGQIVSGIYDLRVWGSLDVALVWLDPAMDISSLDLASLPALTGDGHVRGTFATAERTIDWRTGKQGTRLPLADGRIDPYLEGWDNLSQQAVINRGNYGVSYIINLYAGEEAGLVLSPRGGGFAGVLGAGSVFFNAPAAGVAQAARQLVMVTNLEPRQETRITFMPPAASYLPVQLVAVPYKDVDLD